MPIPEFLAAAFSDPLITQLEAHPPVPVLRQLAAMRRLARPSVWTDREYPGFIVYSQGRTGSTLLTKILSSGKSVYCAGEILYNPVLFPKAWVYAQRALTPNAVYGFKVKIYQLTHDQGIARPEDWMKDLHGRGWRIVYLTRENLVRQVLSNYVRGISGQPHRTAQQARFDHRIEVDPEKFLAYVRLRDRVGQFERRVLGELPRLELSYERDLLDATRHQETLDRAYDFLGVPHAVVNDSGLRRTSVDRIEEMVLNYDALRATLRGTHYEAMLESA